MGKVYAMIFLIFALGFFLFVMYTITKDSRDYYDRKLMEAREFGFEGSQLQKEAHDPKKRS